MPTGPGDRDRLIGEILALLGDRAALARDLPHAVSTGEDAVCERSFTWCLDNVGWILELWAPPDIATGRSSPEWLVWRFRRREDAAWFAMVWG